MENKQYKVLCWESVDPRLNLFNLSASEAKQKEKDLSIQYPNYTFQTFVMLGENC